jgi:hypothetical protein
MGAACARNDGSHDGVQAVMESDHILLLCRP